MLRGLPPMHERCPVCGLRFQREQGYFLGAMYISYGLALAMMAAFSVFLWAATNLPYGKIILWAFLLFLPFVPALTTFSRVLWIYLDQAIDPEGAS